MFKQTLFCILLGTMATAGQVFAEGPCKQDKETFCKAAEGDYEKMKQCMTANADKLSPICKEHLKVVKENISEIKQACSEDTKKFCADVKPGKNRIIKCLEKHKTEVSKECKAEIKEPKAERDTARKAARDATKADLAEKAAAKKAERDANKAEADAANAEAKAKRDEMKAEAKAKKDEAKKAAEAPKTEPVPAEKSDAEKTKTP